jgi:hypothetical protein
LLSDRARLNPKLVDLETPEADNEFGEDESDDLEELK